MVVILASALGAQLPSDSQLVVQELIECSIGRVNMTMFLRKGLRQRLCLAAKNAYDLLDLATPAPNTNDEAKGRLLEA